MSRCVPLDLLVMVYKLWVALALMLPVGYATNVPNTATEPRVKPAIVQDLRITNILRDLRQCESGGSDKAINKVDLDGTASYSRYQFKPSTLYAWGMEYGVLPSDLERPEIMNLIMDGELQEKVLVRAIEKHGKEARFWKRHFPGCNKLFNFASYFD